MSQQVIEDFLTEIIALGLLLLLAIILIVLISIVFAMWATIKIINGDHDSFGDAILTSILLFIVNIGVSIVGGYILGGTGGLITTCIAFLAAAYMMSARHNVNYGLGIVSIIVFWIMIILISLLIMVLFLGGVSAII